MVKPPSNLPPEAQPWARHIEERLRALDLATGVNGQQGDNAFKGLNSSLGLLSEQVATIGEQQDYLASLISKNESTGSLTLSTTLGNLPNNNTWTFSAGPSVTLDIPTGNFRVLLSTDNVSVSAKTPGTAIVYGGLTYGYAGPDNLSPASGNTAYYKANDLTTQNINGPLVRFGTVMDCPPGEYTITAYYAYRYTGTSTGFRDIVWSDLRLAVDVLGK